MNALKSAVRVPSGQRPAVLSQRRQRAAVLPPVRALALAPPPPQQLQAAHEPVALSGEFYEDVVNRLALDALQKATEKASHSGRKYIVGIAGMPGSGKSTLAHHVCVRMNELQAGAVSLVPMDGFHFYRRELDAMPDPQEAHARRGAHWTFDALRFLACVQQIATTGSATAPSFDHFTGDPMEGALHVAPTTRVVLVEGNYVLLSEGPWAELAQLFDDTWFVDIDIDVAMQRVLDRQTGNGLAPDVSRARIASNDRPNAELIAATKPRARVVVPSSVPFRWQ